MLALLAGVVYIIVGIVLWLGNISLDHATAIFIGVFGILLVAYWGFPGGWGRRT